MKGFRILAYMRDLGLSTTATGTEFCHASFWGNWRPIFAARLAGPGWPLKMLAKKPEIVEASFHHGSLRAEILSGQIRKP